MKTQNSESLFKRSLAVTPGGVHSPVRAFKGVGGTPRFIESAQGARMRDVDGNEYIDFCQSWGPLMFGHQDPDVRAAVDHALSRGWTYGAAEKLSLELAELITGSIPWVEKVRFVNSGTEAVMSALRIARAATSRSKILKFEGCYHGHVDSMLVKAGSGLAEMASPDSAGVSKATASETIVVPLDDEEVVRAAFEKHGKEIAALIIEPLPANNGLLIQRKEFLKFLRELTHKHGTLLIFDEVISGFRVAFGGMAEWSGIKPDLVTYGKIIGGGFPVGAYGGRKDLLDWVAPAGSVYQAGTLSGNSVAMAAGIAMLSKLKKENPYADLEKKTEHFASQCEKRLREALDWDVRVERFSSLFWPVLDTPLKSNQVRAIAQIPAKHKERFIDLFHGLLSEGVYLAPSAYEVGFLSTAHTEDDLALVAKSLDRVIEKGVLSKE